MSISKYQFRQLLTFEEKVNITELAKTNSSVQTLLDDLFSADSVDVTLPEVSFGLGYLITLGLISNGRDSEIISQALLLPQIEDSLNILPYNVTIKALSDISSENPWGIVNRGSFWEVRCDFKNNETNEIFSEIWTFINQPTQEELDNKIKETINKIRNR